MRNKIKIVMRNEDELKTWEKENDSGIPEDFLFKLRIEVDEYKVAAYSIAETHAHFLQIAIKHIEAQDYFGDDYDDFIVSSRSYFETNDGDRLTYNVDLSIELEQ